MKYRYLKAVRIIICIAKDYLIGILLGVILLSVFRQAPSVPTEISKHQLNCRVEDCESSLEHLRPDEFKLLTREQKLDIMRDICRIEFTELGVRHGFSVACEELYDEVMAQYCEATYTVTINEKHIDTCSGFSLQKVICHECYHAYQFAMLKGNDAYGQLSGDQLHRKQEVYRAELANYCSVHTDREKYNAQTIETDADAYAEKASIKYLRFYGVSNAQIAGIVEREVVSTFRLFGRDHQEESYADHGCNKR